MSRSTLYLMSYQPRLRVQQFSSRLLMDLRWKECLGLLLVAVLVMIALMTCAQVAYDQAIREASSLVYAAPHSTLQADYGPWEFIVIQPIMPGILEELSYVQGAEAGSPAGIQKPATAPVSFLEFECP